jgi:hypothetical protein
LDELRGRFPAALDYVYDAEACVAGDAIRPGEVAAQVFDHESGVRMNARA